MAYERLSTPQFFDRFCSEEVARCELWRARFGGKDFVCPRCWHESFYQHQARPEIRQCRLCDQRVRLRAGTILEHTKLPILTWLRALFLVTQDKRGVSALQLQRQLGMRSYDTAWRLLHRIREAFRRRDERYTLRGVIELDGSDLGSQSDKGAAKVLLAVESRDWVDERGRKKRGAGFAKVALSRESKLEAQAFLDRHVEPGSLVNTDASNAFTHLRGFDVDHRVMDSLPPHLESWLPWVHRWLQNAKAWLTGTFHGIDMRYLGSYLAEYNYRFNRRHDPNGLFHRALTACASASPIRATELFA